MAESPGTAPETQPVSTRARAKAVAMLTAMGLAMAGGGYAGYELFGEGSVHTDRASHEDQANRDAGCIDAIGSLTVPGQKPVIRLSRLSTDQRADCGADWINPTFDGDNDYSDSDLHGSVASPVMVELPTLADLRANRRQELDAAANVEDIGLKVGGVLLGSIIGFAGSLFGLDKALSYADRRRKRKNVRADQPAAS